MRLIRAPRRIATQYGGAHSVGKRKTQRPFRAKQPIHATFRAVSARGPLSMLHRKRKGYIYLEAFRIADESDVKLYGCVNVGNHIHVVLQARARKNFQRFLRVFAGWIAMLVTGARKGAPLRERFWTLPVYTDIVELGRHFRNVIGYLRKNLVEADGKNTKIIYPRFQIFESSE